MSKQACPYGRGWDKVPLAQSTVEFSRPTSRPLTLPSKLLPTALSKPKEVEILSNVGQHPQILKVHACFLHNQQHFLVMELISGRELEAFLFDSVFEDYAAELRFFASQIVQGMEFLHSRMIGHFDLKGSNLMVDQCRCLK